MNACQESPSSGPLQAPSRCHADAASRGKGSFTMTHRSRSKEGNNCFINPSPVLTLLIGRIPPLYILRKPRQQWTWCSPLSRPASPRGPIAGTPPKAVQPQGTPLGYSSCPTMVGRQCSGQNTGSCGLCPQPILRTSPDPQGYTNMEGGLSSISWHQEVC